MPTESTFLLAGLFLLLAAAGWALGRFDERDEKGDPPPPLNIDYLKGLNFLLNEQTDQALEHFLKMVRVDNKTIETHFALGICVTCDVSLESTGSPAHSEPGGKATRSLSVDVLWFD